MLVLAQILSVIAIICAALLLIIGGAIFLNLPRRGPHEVDRVADHVDGALLAFGPRAFDRFLFPAKMGQCQGR